LEEKEKKIAEARALEEQKAREEMEKNAKLDATPAWKRNLNILKKQPKWEQLLLSMYFQLFCKHQHPKQVLQVHHF